MPGPASPQGKWHLKVCEGRQWWEYDAEGREPHSFLEKHLLTKKSNDPEALHKKANDAAESNNESRTAEQAVSEACKFYASIQTEDGHWTGDYGGPMFLLPGLIITYYITGSKFHPEQVDEMTRYLRSKQNKNGGFGLHIEGPSTVFSTSLNYIAMRLLGVDRDDPDAVQARSWLHEHGGAVGSPGWGKFWMGVLGVYSWEGVNPLPPELWYLPSWLPVHPSRLWCHCRVVYLPMAYIYGARHTAKITPLIEQLREELYVQPYSDIHWPSMRDFTAKCDIYNPQGWTLWAVNKVVRLYERFHSSWFRQKALDCTYDHVKHEDETTKYICIGPVNKVIDMLATWFKEGGHSTAFKLHVERIPDYLWLSDDGMKMQGYNGSQLWDTAFAAQAMFESGLGAKPFLKECMKKTYNYLDISQVREDVDSREKYFRHISKGAWPFSTRDHGWPITDCTSEGLKSVLLYREFDFIENHLEDNRLFDAVNVLLSFQNVDGGWATYELQRGSSYLELLNPSEIFGDIMVDYSYVECTSASVQSLAKFQKTFPDHRSDEITKAIRRGAEFIKSIQRPDGSWYGSWAVCFTYACWFGVEGLLAAGEPANSPAIRKACNFLLEKQLDDGGWGESYMSCVTKQYVSSERSLVVNTGWVVLTLLAAKYEDKAAIKKGVDLLVARQLPNGDYPQEAISGVFNRSCMITYTNYRNIFPIWALGRWTNYKN